MGLIMKKRQSGYNNVEQLLAERLEKINQ